MKYQRSPVEIFNYNKDIVNDKHFDFWSSDSAWHSYTQYQEDQAESLIEGTANLLEGQFILQKNIEDNNWSLYTSGRTQYGSISQNFMDNVYSEEIRVSYNDTTQNDTLIFTGNGRQTGTITSLKITGGIIKTIKSDPVTLLLGLVPTISYRSSRDVVVSRYNQYHSLLSRNQSEITTNFSLPLLAEYSPFSWLLFRGRVSYQITHQEIESDYQIPSYSETFSRNVTEKIDRDSHDTYFNMSGSSYASARFRFSNGLEWQVNFRGTLTDYKDWVITLGNWFD